MTMDGWTLGMEYVSTYGRVRWDVFGGGPPLVLVHGTPFSSYVWRKVVPALVGHDFGGAIPLRAHLLEGGVFRAIALIDAVALSPWGSPFYRLVQDYVGVFRQIPAYMHEAMVAAYVRDATYQPMDDDALKPYIEPWLGAKGQEAFYRQISQNDPRYTDEVQPLYARIDRPVMIVWGEQDRWIPLKRGQQLHEAIPGSQLRRIPRCAHLAQEDAPDTVAELLTGFFAS